MKTTEDGEDSRPITVTSDPPADEPTPEMDRDGADLEAHPLSTDDSDARSMPVESGDDGHDEIPAIVSQVKTKARVLSNLTEQEQEEVALFLARNDFIYNRQCLKRKRGKILLRRWGRM